MYSKECCSPDQMQFFYLSPYAQKMARVPGCPGLCVYRVLRFQNLGSFSAIGTCVIAPVNLSLTQRLAIKKYLVLQTDICILYLDHVEVAAMIMLCMRMKQEPQLIQLQAAEGCTDEVTQQDQQPLTENHINRQVTKPGTAVGLTYIV